MRLRFVFNHYAGNMSIDYNHKMRLWFSDFLMNFYGKTYDGTVADEGDDCRGFKLFTFSKLIFDSYKVREHRIGFYEGKAQWFVSSPVEDFLDDFAEYLKTIKRISVDSISFELLDISEVKMPAFDKQMKFTSLSPITVTTDGLNKRIIDDYFLRFSDSAFINKIKDNLLNKYRLYSGKKIIDDANFSFEFDSDYMERKRGKIQKKIKYERREILGYLAPFKVSGEPELLRFGYDTGFGDYCHLGFGMAKEI
ncbi:CRISPR-associated endoribonuclease Cas6 [Candidatus Magnetomonas plexicatena]|uniref:CRISPR-associated endoribonuclease Cas6 n=1 Tax=Candidatus Magnetomonas plexicatena TaxID=2552947 RepID=UPI001C7617E3|nr:CRISPR-associated endoribonuclease Cas6 [Nitrospirales bacterium LBB_01]